MSLADNLSIETAVAEGNAKALEAAILGDVNTAFELINKTVATAKQLDPDDNQLREIESRAQETRLSCAIESTDLKLIGKCMQEIGNSKVLSPDRLAMFFQIAGNAIEAISRAK